MSYRTIVLTISILLFSVSAPSVILYSQGYRFDFEKMRLTRTGGLFIKTHPAQAALYINQKPKGETSAIFGTKFVQNLLPKNYPVKIAKDGYFVWEKIIEISEKQTSEFKNIILIPKSPKIETLKQDLSYFSVVSSRYLIAVEQDSNENLISFSVADAENPEVFKIYVFRNAIQEISGYENWTFAGETIVYDFIPDKKLLFAIDGSGKKPSYFTADLNAMDITPLHFTDDKKIKKILFYPNDPKRYIALRGESLAILDEKNTLTPAPGEQNYIPSVINFWLKGQELWYLQKADEAKAVEPQQRYPKLIRISLALAASSLASEGGEEYNLNFFELSGKDTLPKTDFAIGSRSILLLIDGKLMALNSPGSEWEQIKSGIEKIYALSRRDETLLWNENEIWVYDPEPQKEKPRLQFIARYLKQIKNVRWFGHSYDYIIFGADKEIEIMELSSGGQKNIVRLPISADEFLFDQKTGALFFISGGSLYKTRLYP